MDTEKIIQEITRKLEPYSLPTVRITPTNETPKSIWSSRFGGKPYWPETMTYPTTAAGDKLILLAQLNFEEVPRLEGYPGEGILQFFIQNDDLYGLDFDRSLDEILKDPNGYRVVYHPRVDKNEANLQREVPSATSEMYMPLSREYSLQFELERELPSPFDYRFDEIAGDLLEKYEEMEDEIYDEFESLGSKLGGYAYFTQDDPRRDEEEGWLLLFQMDSADEDGFDIMWGDVGVGNFFIQKSDLDNLDFTRVWYNWDCS